MSAFSLRRNTCRLCDAGDLELVIPLAPTPLADDYVPADRLGEVQETYPLDLFLCLGCGHLQLLDVLNPEVIFRDYLYETSTSLGLVAHFKRYAEEVMGRVHPPDGSFVVEIGSNDGSLLKSFQDGGMRVLGVDPARNIAQRATASGVETLPAFFTAELARKIKRERGAAAIVTANNVFAHADNLGDMAEGVSELLAPDGVFVFEVAYLVDLIEKWLFDNIYHEHLCNHTVKPLRGFLRRHGMELTSIERVDTKGGSIRGFAKLASSSPEVSPSVDALVDLETSLGFDRPERYRAFAAKIAGVKSQLGDLLRDLNGQGKTIAGYGASHSVTTLVYYFDIGDIPSFIVDDNKLKHNLFSPGHHIPVLPPDEIYRRKPDYVLILAWQYSKPITSKHQAYLDQGGHFIVPMPEVRVI